jgi:gliding motility-associated-like protein
MVFRLPTWLFVTFFWLVAFGVSAQTKRANHWYFGFGSAIDFNTSPPTVTRSSPMEQLEGSASISDEEGRLLFYTDGRRIWTSQHTVMPNGSGLLGDESASQSALIVPKPGSQTQYYVFTVPAWGNVITVRAGLAYSLVDLSLNQGLGDIVAGKKNITLLPGPVTEKLAATLHSNGEDVWVVASKHQTNSFYAYRVSRQGVAACPVISQVGQVQSEFQGYLKFSPDGTRLAVAQALNNLELFTFDACTGTLAPYTVIPKWGTSYGNQSHFYGLSFSPNGSKLYVSTGWFFFDGCPKIYQYDLTAQDIVGSRFMLYDNTADRYNCFSQGEGALQLAPDGKIYIASWSYNYLHVIPFPDEAGGKAGFVKDGLALGTRGGLGLPNFIENYFNPRPSVRACASTAGARANLGNDTILCPGAVLSLDLTHPGFSYRWQDGSTSPTYTISKAGTYWVDWTTASCTSRDTIRVKYDQPRHIDLGNDTILCAGKSITLSFPDPKLDFSWSDRSTGKTLVVDQPGTYWVRYRTPNTACWESDSLRVSLAECREDILIPNVITPNEDGFNDVFMVVGLPPVAWRLEVYDRWGKQVAAYGQYHSQWNAQGLENGLYFYILSNRVNKQRYRGWVHVLR